nr:MAG TPA_asm: hypothetical protein [Caudoviricetes sp.]
MRSTVTIGRKKHTTVLLIHIIRHAVTTIYRTDAYSQTVLLADVLHTLNTNIADADMMIGNLGICRVSRDERDKLTESIPQLFILHPLQHLLITALKRLGNSNNITDVMFRVTEKITVQQKSTTALPVQTKSYLPTHVRGIAEAHNQTCLCDTTVYNRPRKPHLIIEIHLFHNIFIIMSSTFSLILLMLILYPDNLEPIFL